MKTEELITYEDYISPLIKVIIKNKTDIITNKIFSKTIPFKSILISEGLPYDIDYIIEKTVIDINKPLIELISNNIDEITDLELIIESEDILDTSDNIDIFKNNSNFYYKILSPYEKPFRILFFNSQENNISIKKYDKDTLIFFDLINFSLFNASYCNTFNDLYLTNGENNFLYKINNIKINIEKLDEIPWKKKFHSMIYIPKKYIFFIGGNNRVTFYYEYINKIFKLWAPLKYKEKNPGLIYLNKTYIYCFGHQKKLGDLNFIERTNIKRKPKWDVINIKLSEPFNLKKYATVLSNDNKIFFLGGKKIKDERIFFFDLTNNEINKTTQINTAMKLNETNFYNINQFTSVIIPQESNGDIKLIAFNQRTKKFRKLRYERDLDLISENKLIELNETNLDSNLNEENIKITTEINLKKLENKFENEKEREDIENNVQEDEVKIPSLMEIKKLLLGDKNIMNKNVEAMIFNRQRIKNKKLDKIDAEESENEYDYNSDEEDNNENNVLNNEKSENNSDEENEQKNMKINLRTKHNINVNDNIMGNKNSKLRNIFDKDVDDKIDFLKVKNPRITIEDYKNLMFYNRISSSYINAKPTNSLTNSTQINTGVKTNKKSPFQFGKENKLHFDLTSKKSNNKTIDNKLKQNLNEDINDKKENINNNIKEKKEEINDSIKENIKESINSIKDNNKDSIKNNIQDSNKDSDKNSINLKTKYKNKTAVPENYILKNNSLDINKLNNNKVDDQFNNMNSEYIMDATIKGKMTSIIGENNFGVLKANDTYKSLTLKELFGGDVDEKVILNSGMVVVPGINSVEIEKGKSIKKDENKDINNNKSEYEIFEGIIEGTKTKSIKPPVVGNNIEIKKPEVEIKTKIPEIDINIKDSKISNKDNKIPINLKEIFSKDIDDEINLKVVNPELWGIDNNNNKGIINDENNKLDLKIEGPSINFSGVVGNNNLPEISKDIKIPDINLNINKNDVPNKTLQQIFGEDINDNINLNILKPELWPTEIKDISEDQQKINVNVKLEKPEIKGSLNLPKEMIRISQGSDLGNAEISIYTELKPVFTLKEEFGKDIDDNIILNKVRRKLNLNLDEMSYNDSSVKASNNIEINGSNVNIPNFKLKVKEPNVKITGDVPSVELNDIQIQKPNINANINGNIPGIEIDLKNSKNIKTELQPETLKDIMNEDIDSPYNLNIKKHPLYPNIEFKAPEIPIENIVPKVNIKTRNPKINIDGNLNPNIKMPVYEIITGEIPGKNSDKPRTELISGEIPGINITGRKTEISVKKPKLETNIKINEPNLTPIKPDINVNMKGPKIKVEKPEFDINIKNNKLDNEENDFNKNTLKDIFSGDINEKIKLNVINPKLWGTDITNNISGSLEDKNININLPSIDMNIKPPKIDIPKVDLKDNIDANTNINGNISINKPELELKKPDIDLNVNIPNIDLNLKKEFDPKITLKDIFSKDIDDDIILNVIKPELWGIDDNNYISSELINGKAKINIPSLNINIKEPNINLPKAKTDLNIEADINKPKIELEGKKVDIDDIDINVPDINTTKLRGPKVDVNIKKPKIGLDIQSPNINLDDGKIKIDIDNNTMTLKDLFNQDINDNIILKVINPRLWGNDGIKSSRNLYRSTKLKFPKRNVDMNDPNIHNMLNYSLKDSINRQSFNGDIKIGVDIPKLDTKIPNLSARINTPTINTNIKRPNLDNINKKQFYFDKYEEENKTETLKDLFNDDINDKISLNIKKPELWGIDYNSFNKSGLIEGNIDLLLPKTNLNIDVPNINIPNPSLKGINKPKVNLNGDIQEKNININKPKIKIDVKAPDINANIGKPNFDINGMKLSVERNSKIGNDITLKDLFNEDINEKINLNIKKPELWDVDNVDKIYKEGLIDADLNLKLPEANININKPNINIPDFSLKGDIKKPKIETDLNYELSDSIPSLTLNEPNINKDLKVKKPEIKAELNKPNIDVKIPGIKFDINDKNKYKDKKGYLSLTLKDLFNDDIDEDIHLNVIKPPLWGTDDYSSSGFIESNNKIKLPKVDINIKGPQINLPEFNTGKKEAETNLNIPDINLDVKKPKLDANIPDINIPSPSINKEKIDLDIDVKTNIQSRNKKKIIEETISGEIPGVNINKARTEVFTGEIPGTKIKNTQTNISPEIKKPDLNMNIKGKIPDVKIKNEIEVNKPKIDVNADLPDFDIGNFYINDIEPEPSVTLKKLFSGDVNDEIYINLNKIKQPLWGDENTNTNISNPNKGNINIKLPDANINVKETDIYVPEIDISELDSDMKISDKNFNLSKPNLKAKINGKIPKIDINNKVDINKNINVDIPEMELDLENKNINLLSNNDRFNPTITLKDVFSKDIDDNFKLKILNNKLSPDLPDILINDDSNAPPSNFNIELKGPEINMPNVKFQGVKNNVSINNSNNFDENINVDIPKINVDVTDPNVSKKEIDLKVKFPGKKVNLPQTMTLRDLFGQNVDENNFYDLNIEKQDLILRNNTLYISGENDKINYYPTDDISIKGPNMKYPSKNGKINFELNQPKINIELENKEKSIDSEIIHNIPNNFESKIKLPEKEENNININANINNNKNITLKEIYSKDINGKVNLTLLKKNIDNDNKEEDEFEPYNVDENIQGDIIPINIDIKYKTTTNSNDIHIISPSKKDKTPEKYHKTVTLKELFNMDVNAPFNFTNTHVDYDKEKKEEKNEEINNELNSDDDFLLPGEDDIRSLNSITKGLQNKNNNINSRNNDNNKPKEEENKNDKENSWDEYDLI